MNFSAETLDDVLQEVYRALLEQQTTIDTSHGATSELTGASIEIRKPRARLSRTETRGKLFSCLGELLWYLAQADNVDFIRHYIPNYPNDPDKDVVYGAYGPRLFNLNGINQIEQIITLLKANPLSRRAVIQLFEAKDNLNSDDKLLRHKEIPCTVCFQFFLRNNLLDMITYMRSNDAFIGLPHDIFCFTMLQEIISRSLEVDIGSYKHFVGSLHLYHANKLDAEDYLKEGFTYPKEMPAMPNEMLWDSIKSVLEAEQIIRKGGEYNIDLCSLPPYWKDIILLLMIHSEHMDKINILESKIAFKNIYMPYIREKKEKGRR